MEEKKRGTERVQTSRIGERGKENYLRIIYELDEGKGIRSIDLAKQLNISKASVSEMLRKLAKENLLRIKPYSKIFLTRKGKKQAENLFDKHYTIKNFIKKFLNYEHEKAGEEAHKLEHAFSDESVKIISRILEETPESNLKLKPSYIG